MIYQELSLAPELSVEANILLGRELQHWGLVDRRATRARVSEALCELDHPELRPERRLRELGPGARQLVEIARALVSDARLIVLDEPTSSLGAHDVSRLFALIERLRARQVSVIYISHVLEELERIADRYTVLRDGRSVASGTMPGTPRAQIIAAMVGRELAEAFPRVEHQSGAPILELQALAGAHLPHDASLVLRRGEIFGIAGLMGAGRTELLRALFGLDLVARGTIAIAGVRDQGARPWVRWAQRVGFVSEQRKEEGLWLERSVIDNVTAASLDACTRWGFVDRSVQRALSDRQLAALRVRADAAASPVATLSGGNQQKVALARLLCCDAEVLLLDEPTRGIDVGSKAEIYRLIGELARAGKAVLLVSSYLPELFGVCDRIAVMCKGQLGAARPVSEWSEAEVMREATRAA
jgi:ribose transport system ATP-binding protein